MGKRSNIAIGDAGELLIASEACRRKYIVLLAKRNTEIIDLCISNGIKTINGQVKTSEAKYDPYAWDVGKNKPPKSDILIYFFVNMYIDLEKPIDYWIVPADIVKENVNWTQNRPQFRIKAKDREEFNKKYKKNWNLVKNKLN